MTRRGLIILSAFTAIAVLLAIWLSYTGPGKAPGEGNHQISGQPLFPGLGDKLAAVRKISLSGPEGAVSLAFQEGRWRVGERYGYAADFDQVLSLLAGLVRATRLEPKTADEERLDQIGLGEDAVSVTITGGEGSTLAALRIGNPREPASAKERKTFVWVAGDDRSWLVSALPSLTTSPILWLNREIISLSSVRISGVAITRSNGDNLTLVGQANNIPGLRAQGQTANENLAGGPANQTLTALAHLEFSDVARAGEITGTVTATAVYTTFDGLVVEVKIIATVTGGTWARLSARYDADAMLSEDNPGLMADVPADGAAEAADLNARWTAWMYSLAAPDAEALTRPRSAVVSTTEGEK